MGTLNKKNKNPCVEHFGINYFSKNNADYFVRSLCKHYVVLIDCDFRNQIGFNIEFNY